MRTAREKVEGLPALLFRLAGHRHGADVKIVQAWLRHGVGENHLDTYGHLWPDKDESTKAVIYALVDSKFRDLADSLRTEGGAP